MTTAFESGISFSFKYSDINQITGTDPERRKFSLKQACSETVSRPATQVYNAL